MLVPRYKLFLCHTPIKLDLLGFPGIDVFASGLRDHVITRFASFPLCNTSIRPILAFRDHIPILFAGCVITKFALVGIRSKL